jgi:hypothetical protein
MDTEEIINRFTYHAPKAGQAERYEKMRAYGEHFAMHLLTDCVDCRERSLAVTAMEEAIFWANAAIARRE